MSVSELSSTDPDTQWYVLQGRDISGPFSAQAVRAKVRDRSIGPDARVAPAGASQWQPLDALMDQAASHSPAPLQASRPVGSRRYAGFWIRVGAYVLDAIIVNVCVFVLSFVVFFVIGFIVAAKTGDGGRALNSWIAAHKIYLNLIGIVFWVGYETLFVGGPWQATPGKRICAIHVTRPSGARIGYGRALGRYLCYMIDTLILLIGFMMAGWTKEKTALHDLICDTRVVHGRPQPHARAVASSF